MMDTKEIKEGVSIYLDIEEAKKFGFNDDMEKAWTEKNPRILTGISRLSDESGRFEFEGVSGGFWSYKLKHFYPSREAFILENHERIAKHEKELEAIRKKKEALVYVAGEDVRVYVKRILPYVDTDRKKALKTFLNCVLPEDVEESINDALTVILRADKFEEWGINSHFEKGLTNSVLLYGESGTGKTMIAESFAGVLGKNIMSISTGDLQSNVPGETERNIKKNFDLATENNAVIVLDECDSLLTSRDMVGAIMGAETNELLRCIERFSGVVILTTNRIHRLDSALERRIISKIELSAPSQPARQNIFKNLVPKKTPLSDDVDFKKLSELELTGGQIKNTILLAVRRAISKNQEVVTMSDFLRGASQELEYRHKNKKSLQEVYA